MYHTQFMKIG